MHRFWLVLALVVTLLRIGEPPARLGQPEPPIHASSGDGVCSVDPHWGIELEPPPLDESGNVRVPRNIDPAFNWPVPCFGGKQAANDPPSSVSL